MGLVLDEMAMSRREMVNRCVDFAVPFMEHWLKVYLASLPEASQSDKQTIPHWLSEMESNWANHIANIILANGNKPLPLNYYVNLFLTPYDPYGMFYSFAKGDSFPHGLARIAEANGGEALNDAASAYESFVAKAKEALKGKPNRDWPELTIGAFKQVLPKEGQKDEPKDGSEEGLDVNEIVWGYIDEHEDEIVTKNKSREIEEEYDDCFHGANWDDEEDVAERYEDWVTRWHLDDYGELMALPLPKDGAECKARIADYAKYDIHHDETVFDTYAEEALEKYDVLYEDAVDDFENRMYEFFDKFVSIALPRVRDFRGVPVNSFDGRGNYAMGVKEQLIFPEISYDQVEKIRGFDICFVTTAKTDEEARELLGALGMPFKK